jgi:predicted nucleotidyltransferase
MEPSSHPLTRAIARRRREREALLADAGEYVERLSARLPVDAAAVIGSVARGDFNRWSDVDVVILSEALPERLPERLELLFRDRSPRLEPWAFTARELRALSARGDPRARELATDGVVLCGEDRLAELLGPQPSSSAATSTGGASKRGATGSPGPKRSSSR